MALPPREPSAPRKNGGRPNAGKWLQYSVPVASGGREKAMLTSFDVYGVRKQAHVLNLSDLPDLKKLPKDASGRRMGESITCPSMPGYELAVSEAMSDLMSDTTSTADDESLKNEGSAGLQRVNAIAGDDEWAPLLLEALFRPASELSPPLGDEAIQGPPPNIDDCKRILSSLLPPPRQHRSDPNRFCSEPVRPTQPREEAPAQARPSHAGRSLSVRGGRRPRSAGS